MLPCGPGAGKGNKSLFRRGSLCGFQKLPYAMIRNLIELVACKTTSYRGTPMKETIDFRLNGKPVKLEVEGDRTLLWVLRTDLELTGTKFGCGISLCGACTVVVGKEAVRSCQLQVREVRGKEVTTIEGLARNGNLHPLQKAFAEYGALQCGFCTPGMIMTAYALLLKNPKMTRAQIMQGMEQNLCRCAAHQRIVQAIESVSTK
jgi:nicotinate dehydrogenase subunit A